MTAETPPLTRGRPGTSCRGPARTQKHPRLRGDDGRGRRVLPGERETPPLTRGRRRPGLRRRWSRQKHPRLRGEDICCTMRTTPLMETPPLTRGRRPALADRGGWAGNTPAYAGKTDGPILFQVMEGGNTPAYAGKTSTNRQALQTPTETPPLTRGRPLAPRRDPLFGEKHPRLRGEDQIVGAVGTMTHRNTPAYAGKTRPRPPACGSHEKHPRLRGEDDFGLAADFVREETPPLTRGRLRVLRAHRRARENTPAYAGKTNRYDKKRKADRKHPRLRGEDRSAWHWQVTA